MENQKIIYFEYGGRMNCHYNPQQDNLTSEEFINKLRIFRNKDNIRVDWHNRYIDLKYTGGEQVIKVFEEEREWDDQGQSTRKSYQLVKSLDVPEYQGEKPQPIYQNSQEVSTPLNSRPQTPKTTKSEPIKKDTSYLDEHQKELSEHLEPEKSPSEILKVIKSKKRSK